MNNEQRKKLKIFKYANEENIKKIQWKNNILLQECLNNLETYQIISDDAIIRQIVKIASGIEIKRRFHSDIPMIEKNHDYYIVWDNERVPIIKCKGNDIIENWDDVLAVAFDTWEVEENLQTLQNAEQRVVDLRLVLRTLREMTDIKELTPTLVNSLIERIEVHNSDKSNGHSHVKVDIYFTAVGMIDIPTEKEILATMEEIRNNPQDFKFVA